MSFHFRAKILDFFIGVSKKLRSNDVIIFLKIRFNLLPLKLVIAFTNLPPF